MDEDEEVNAYYHPEKLGLKIVATVEKELTRDSSGTQMQAGAGFQPLISCLTESWGLRPRLV